MDFLDGISDEDEEIVEFFEWERRPYRVRPRRDHFEEWDEVDFFSRFRLKKETVLFVLANIEHEIETPTDRNNAVTPMNKLLLTLRFYALGTMLVSADFIGVSKSCACNIIRQVSFALARLAPQFIRMPVTNNEIMASQMEFYQKARVPRVIGAIDCTHVRIESSGGHNAEVFRNRKGYFSINVQTVSSANLKILDIVARWPGSAHDQTIFDNSAVKRQLENNAFGRSLLVADSGCTNTMHVITPLLATTNAVEELYNEAVICTRNPAERLYGVWKRRFPVLSLGLRLKVDTTLAVIVATAVLHNIACNMKEEEPPNDPELYLHNVIFEEWQLDPVLPENVANARTQLLADYFPTLL